MTNNCGGEVRIEVQAVVAMKVEQLCYVTFLLGCEALFLQSKTIFIVPSPIFSVVRTESTSPMVEMHDVA